VRDRDRHRVAGSLPYNSENARVKIRYMGAAAFWFRLALAFLIAYAGRPSRSTCSI